MCVCVASSTSGSKKQSVPYSTSRSGSLDRSGHSHHGHYPAALGMTSQDYPGGSPAVALAAAATAYGVQGLIPAAPGTVPSQPIVQDPSMPLLTPPNPITQLEEAKRRLEDESLNRHMLKSK